MATLRDRTVVPSHYLARAVLVGFVGALTAACASSDREPLSRAPAPGDPPPVVPGATFQDDASCLGIYGTVPLEDESGSHSFQFQGVLESADGVACVRTGSAAATCAPDAGQPVCSFTWRCGSCDYALSLRATGSDYSWEFGAFQGPPCFARTEIPTKNLCAQSQ